MQMGMKEIFTKFGLHLAPSSANRNFLSVDQNVFILKLKKHLLRNPDCVDYEFIENLYSEGLILASLSPTMSDPLGCDTLRGVEQDSLTRILLEVDQIRDKLFVILLKKVAEHIDVPAEPNIVRLIINEMRQLGKNGLSSKFITDYIDLIAITYSSDLSSFLLDSVIEIFDDSSFQVLCSKLSSLYLDRPELRPNILSTVAQMYEASPNAIESGFVSTVIKHLPHAQVKHLSCIIRFLFVAHTEDAVVDVFSFLVPDSVVVQAFINGILYRPPLIQSFLDLISKAETLREVDLLLLFNMFALNMYKNKILSIMREKILNGKICDSAILTLFKNCSNILSANATLRICALSMKSAHRLVNEFACNLYFAALSYIKSDDTIDLFNNALVNHIFFGSSRERTLALELLERLKSLQCFSLLRVLLDNDPCKFDIEQGAVLYRFIIKTAIQKDSILDKVMRSIVHHLNNDSSQKIGVIAAITALLCLTEENKQWYDIKPLFFLLFNSTRKDSKRLCFFYDEISFVANDLMKNSSLMQELIDQSLLDFNSFIKPISSLNENGAVLQFGLDTCNNDANAVCICQSVEKSREMLALSIFNDTKPAISSPNLLCPSLRLTNMIVNNWRISLSGSFNFKKIIVLPVSLHSFGAVNTLSDMDKASKDALFDSYFYALNWFRELLNASVHAGVDDHTINTYAIERLKNICDLEDVLRKYLGLHPTYAPPCVHFADDYTIPKVMDLLPTQKCTSSKRKRKKIDNPEILSGAELSSLRQSVNAMDLNDDGICGKELSEFNIELYSKYACVREIDLKAYRILAKAAFSYSKDSSSLKQNEICLREIDFVSTDLCHKTSFYLKKQQNTHVRRHDLSSLFRSLNQLSFEEFLNDITGPLAFIFSALIKETNSSGSCFSHTSECDSIVSPSRLALHERCLEKLFTNLYRIFACRQCVDELFNNFCLSVTSSSNMSQAFNALFSFHSNITSFATAGAFLRCVHAYQTRNPSANVRSSVTSLNEMFIQRDWLAGQKEKINGPLYNKTLLQILRDYLGDDEVIQSGVPDEICLYRLIKIIDGSADVDEKYLTLRKNTARIYFNALLEHVVNRAQTITFQRAKMVDGSVEAIKKWSDVVKLFSVLVTCVRNCASVRDQKFMVRNIVRHGNKFVIVFAKHALPLLDVAFFVYKEESLALLKNLQPCTRYLHHACTQSISVLHDVSLSKIIPNVKKLLEKFIYDVQKILRKNGLHEAFTCGQLKNRNLRGEEISSQIVTFREDDNESSAGGDESEEDNDEEESNDD